MRISRRSLVHSASIATPALITSSCSRIFCRLGATPSSGVSPAEYRPMWTIAPTLFFIPSKTAISLPFNVQPNHLQIKKLPGNTRRVFFAMAIMHSDIFPARASIKCILPESQLAIERVLSNNLAMSLRDLKFERAMQTFFRDLFAFKLSILSLNINRISRCLEVQSFERLMWSP